MRHIRALKASLLIVCLLVLLTTGCQEKDSAFNIQEDINDKDGIKIGFSMGTLQEERWQRDRDIFVARAQELGAEVIVLNAYNDNEEQIRTGGLPY